MVAGVHEFLNKVICARKETSDYAGKTVRTLVAAIHNFIG